MRCPDCQSDLTQTDFRGIKIAECASCKGHWFDRNELGKAKDKTDEDLRWLDFDPFGKAAEKFAVDSKEKECPSCGVKMSSLTYDKSNVIIEKCADCHGVWIHHGEFEKIIGYLENLVSTETASSYVKDTFKQFIEIGLGSEHFVSELQDFLVVFKLLELRFGIEHPKISKATNKIYEYLPFL